MASITALPLILTTPTPAPTAPIQSATPQPATPLDTPLPNYTLLSVLSPSTLSTRLSTDYGYMGPTVASTSTTGTIAPTSSSSTTALGPTSDPAPGPKQSPSLSAGAAAGIAIGATLLVVFLAFFGYRFWKGRRLHAQQGPVIGMAENSKYKDPSYYRHELEGGGTLGERGELEDEHGLYVARERGRAELSG